MRPKQCLLLSLVVATLLAQPPDLPLPKPPGQETEPKLPNGKSQRDAILKADHEKSLEDVRQMIKLAEDLQTELEKNDIYVVSISSIKKTDEIEKLAKRIRGRLKRF